MIYIGNNEISNIYIGTDKIYGIYAGDLQIYPTDFGIVTAISLENLVWVTDVPHSGGTADSGNCSFSVIAYYDNGKSENVTHDATISGSLVVPETTANIREMVGTLTLTASYSGFTATGSVDVYQEAATSDFSTKPLTFNILSAGTINWTASNTANTKTIEYKLNNGAWVSITSNTGSSAPTITVNSGDKIQFRGNNAQYGAFLKYNFLYNSFTGSTASFEAEGNIMSLIYGDNFKNELTISSTYALAGLFRNCTKLASAENLVLPATTLANYCYQQMFSDCASLTTAPALPATTLVNSCYANMFSDCTSLTQAPALPATTLAERCYDSMFYDTNILPDYSNIDFASSTVVASGVLQGLFAGTKVTDNDLERLLPKNDNGKYYLPVTTLADNCYASMFKGCKSLTTAPKLPATTLKFRCYSSMFAGCTSLTTAPELPATTLKPMCYSRMFSNCTSLNYIKCLATDISAFYPTSSWVSGVASTGTFVKNPNMTSWTEGKDGIPSGWDIEDA